MLLGKDMLNYKYLNLFYFVIFLKFKIYKKVTFLFSPNHLMQESFGTLVFLYFF